MNGARLVAHQFRYDRKTFWRDPAAVFFTVALPLIFLFIFVTIFGNASLDIDGREIKGSTYYLPGIITLALVSATFVNLAISLTIARERGLLKRVRKTPLPPWAFMAARIATSIVVALLLTFVLVVLGRLVYGVAIPQSTLPGALLALALGAACFCALGFALSGPIPSENAAPAITNAIVLPLLFISGVFIPDSEIPAFMRSIAEVFPIKHLYEALLTSFDPATSGAGIEWLDLTVLVVWGVAGLALALRTFQWLPRSRS